jgi:hypothetical protein
MVAKSRTWRAAASSSGQAVRISFELGPVGLGEVLGVRHDPADDPAGLRRRPGRGRRSWRVLEEGAVGLVERAEVTPDAQDFAGEALLAQFAVELGNAVAAVDPPLVQVDIRCS